MQIKEKCRKCRRYQTKLFLKGEKCFSQKCPMVKRPYPPGERKRKRRSGGLSEYAKQLAEKQKLKLWYLLTERQLKNYVKKILKARHKTEDVGHALISLLEMRLDCVVFRMGFATSKLQARQLVSHGMFLVNGKPVNIPSFILKVGDIISLKETKKKKVVIEKIKENLKRATPPSHLVVDAEKMEGKIVSLPKFEEIAPPIDLYSVFEFYSK